MNVQKKKIGAIFENLLKMEFCLLDLQVRGKRKIVNPVKIF